MLRVCKIGEEVLRQKATPIESVTDEIKQLAKEMLETMKEENGVGLAAPQVGKSIRMFVVNADDDVDRTFINPQIVKMSSDLVDYEEGCLSIPSFYENIKRPSQVTIQFTNENGEKQVLDADGLLARVIQHENDHLDGILYVDHGDAEFKKNVEETFAKRRERAEKKALEKEAKAKRIAAKIAAKKQK
jgi:peptide deformylase